MIWLDITIIDNTGFSMQKLLLFGKDYVVGGENAEYAVRQNPDARHAEFLRVLLPQAHFKQLQSHEIRVFA